MKSISKAWILVLVLLSSCTGSEHPATAADPRSSDLSRGWFQLYYEQLAETTAARHERYSQELDIASCMAEQGFEYKAVAGPKLLRSEDEISRRFEDASTMDPASLEFRERYGFGVSTLLAYLTVDHPPDPNEMTVLGFSEMEKASYFKALVGVDPSRLSPESCVGSLEVITQGEMAEPTLFQSRSEVYNEVAHRVLASPLYVDAEAKWSRCVRDLGYELDTHDDIRPFIERRLREIDSAAKVLESEAFLVADEGYADSPEGVALGDYEIVDRSAVERSGSPYREDELVLVQQVEIEMALAIVGCDHDFWSIAGPIQDELMTSIANGG